MGGGGVAAVPPKAPPDSRIEALHNPQEESPGAESPEAIPKRRPGWKKRYEETLVDDVEEAQEERPGEEAGDESPDRSNSEEAPWSPESWGEEAP